MLKTKSVRLRCVVDFAIKNCIYVIPILFSMVILYAVADLIALKIILSYFFLSSLFAAIFIIFGVVREEIVDIKRVNESLVSNVQIPSISLRFGEEKECSLVLVLPVKDELWNLPKKYQFLKKEKWDKFIYWLFYELDNLSSENTYIIKFHIPKDEVDMEILQKYYPQKEGEFILN